MFEINSWNEINELRRRYVEDKDEIMQRIADGDDSVRYRLVEGNMLLVIKIAYEFMGRGMPIDEIVSEGNISLIKASNKFRVDGGAQFSTYLSTTMKRDIRAKLKTMNTLVRETNGSGINAINIRGWAISWEIQNGKKPSMEEIKKQFPDFSERRLRAFMCSMITRMVSSEDYDVIDHLYTRNDMVDEDFRKEELNSYLENLMSSVLKERTIQIIKLRLGFIDGECQAYLDISKSFGVSRERVRQIFAEGINRLSKFVDPNMIHEVYQPIREREQVNVIRSN